MLGRLIASHSRHFRRLSTTLSPSFHPPPPFLSLNIPKFLSSSHFTPRPFSTNHSGNNNNNNDNDNDNGEKPTSDIWKMGQEEAHLDDIFDTHDVPQQQQQQQQQSWEVSDSVSQGNDGGLFEEFGGNETGTGGGGLSPMGKVDEWKVGEEEKMEDLFGIEDGVSEDGVHKETEIVSAAQKLVLEKEQSALLDVLQGPNRAFGDLVAQSGITDEMLDSLIALKNFQDIEGLPPLTQIEDECYESTTRKSSRYEMELQKQEEAAKARVRQVDEKGRAYGTGKRKCSIARVWIQPGEGKFLINDKEYDVYFPMLDQRAALLRPFSETKTLGLWDVKCTVKGGGVTGQVDAIRLGISRALQNWEPGLRPPLREAGFLTRDSRVVERKKPGKAKARKSFQWVKR